LEWEWPEDERSRVRYAAFGPPFGPLAGFLNLLAVARDAKLARERQQRASRMMYLF
jgi:hypothetical protein